MISGQLDQKPWTFEYHLRTNASGDIVFFEYAFAMGNLRDEKWLEYDENGNWTINGNPAPEWKGINCFSLAFSPLLHWLNLKKLALAAGSQAEIKTLHLHFPEPLFTGTGLLYRCLSPGKYTCENTDSRSVLEIQTDDNLQVTLCPGVFYSAPENI